MADLPPELIEDILLRLPVKSLLRFRSISKPWCALIDTPDFIKNHLNRSIATKSNRSLYLVNGSTISALDLNSLHTGIEHEFRFKDPFLICITGSCNGLLLLQQGVREWDIALFNPATRQYRIISTPPTTIDVRYGLGYDSVNDDYKVIEVVRAKEVAFLEIVTCNEVKIYSLKLNSWREVEAKFPWDIDDSDAVIGVHLNGCLHKVVVSSADSRANIVVFDLVTEKSRLIPLPEDIPIQWADVVVFEGYLCVLATNQLYTDMWMMRDYGVNSSWVKFLSIGPPHITCYSIFPLALSRNGEEVLLKIFHGDLVWYDLERRSVRKAQVLHGQPFTFHSKVSVDSLISLDGSRKSVGIEKEVKEEESKQRTIIITRDDSSPGFGTKALRN